MAYAHVAFSLALHVVRGINSAYIRFERKSAVKVGRTVANSTLLRTIYDYVIGT